MTSPELDVAPRMRRHFEQGGVLFDRSSEEIDKAIKQLLGKRRFREFSQTQDARAEGEARSADIYALFQTAREWNALFSGQLEAMLAVALWLDGKLRYTTPPGSQICELGCGAGLLTNWLAGEHPECRVVGVDAMPNLIAAAQREPGPANREFALWDYTQPKPDSLPRFDRLVCSFGIDLGDDPVKETKEEFAQRHFRGWREAAQDNAHLCTVLRIPDLETCRAVVAGAHAAGWSLVVSESDFVTIPGERFPALSFVARKSPAPHPDVLRSLWLKKEIKDRFPRALLNEEAKAFFEALGDKQILESGPEIHYWGMTTTTVIGTAHVFGFSYSTSPTGFARLEIVPLADVDQLSLEFDWQDPTEPSFRGFRVDDSW